MNEIAKVLAEKYLPIIIALVLGILIGARGCYQEPVQPEVRFIEKPIPEIRFVDRWKTDTTRFTSLLVTRDTLRDTFLQRIVEVLVDTVIVPDTIAIVNSFLTEEASYDTSVTFKHSLVRLRWTNYQNRSENIQVSLQRNSNPLRINMYARTGLATDFKGYYAPVVGAGLLLDRNKFLFGTDYSFATNHQITLTLGYRL